MRFDVIVVDRDGNTVKRFSDVTYLIYLQVRQEHLGDPDRIVILDEH